MYNEVSKTAEQSECSGQKFSINGVLSKLELSKSGYYGWINRVPSETELKRSQNIDKILEIYDESHQIYGAPKITKKLNQEDIKISERTVGKYMKLIGIRAHYIKPYKQTTINPDFSMKLHNILKQQFNPEVPNAIWCTDITYIHTSEGFVYLTSIMDLYSRKIVSWTLSETLEAENVVKTVLDAIASNDTKPLVIHSDRGCQYVSCSYFEATEGIKLSYSKKAYPWDNACIESFHSLLKREWLNRYKIRDFAHAYTLIFEYINTFYNTVRIHSHCDYLSPLQMENQYFMQLKNLA